MPAGLRQYNFDCRCQGGGLLPGLEVGFVRQLLPCEALAGSCCGSGARLVAGVLGDEEAAVGVDTGMGSSICGGMLLRYQYYLSRARSAVVHYCQLWLG